MSEAFAAGFFRLASEGDGKVCLVLAEDEETEKYEDEGYEEGESVEYDSLTPAKFCMYCGTRFEFEEAG